MIVLDFETKAIELRPAYPPKPVGVAIWNMNSNEKQYLCWGHPTGNNCQENKAKTFIKKFWGREQILFHNAKFDMEVAQKWWGLPILPTNKFEDTLFILFLLRPHSRSLSLKPSAVEILNVKPLGQEKLRNWLIDNKVVRPNDRQWGAYISEAPGSMTERYAIEDCVFTGKLWKWGWKQIISSEMETAYVREKRLLPLLLANEQKGMKLNVKELEKDIEVYQKQQFKAGEWIRRKLRSKNLNLDSNDALADALEKQNLAAGFLLTEKGKRSVKKESLELAIKDKKLLSAINYYNRVGTCLNTFMLPWLEIASRTNNTINCTWHQVRQGSHHDSVVGARTGRLITSDPNVLNLAKPFEDENKMVLPFPLTPLPTVRKYIIPDEGCTWLHRDYNQQELRILAHYEDDKLLRAYEDNPKIDLHDFVKEALCAAGFKVERKETKIINFGLIYGMGIEKLARRLKSEYEKAKELKNAQLGIIPGLKVLSRGIKQNGDDGNPIRTWGGRLYYAESPRVINGEERSLAYKLLNYLIQGSAADCTKEAVIRYHEQCGTSRFLVTVYDEINICAPHEDRWREMKILKDCMESIEFDVMMLSDGKYGPNWGTLKNEPKHINRMVI